MESQHFANASILCSHENLEIAIKYAIENRNEESLNFLTTQYKTESKRIISSSNLFHIAAKNRAVGIIQILLDSGVSIDVLHEGKTPLMTATDVIVIQLLLSRGADVNMRMSESSLIFKYLLHHFVGHNFKQKLMNSFSESDSDKQTEDIVMTLLNYGACVDSRDFCNRTPLHVAADRKSSPGILRLLLDKGARVNVVDDSQETPLHKSAQIMCAENVKFLLEAGADVHAMNCAGRSAIFGAYEVDVFKMLLESGCNVGLEDSEGNTVFTHIIQEGLYQLSFLQYLIDIGCDRNHRNQRGYSALLLASKFVESDVLKYLVDVGADVNAETSDHKTPLMILLRKLWNRKAEAIECMNYLLDHGATVDNVTSSVIHVLISSGCLSLIPRFISCGLAPSYLTREKSAYAWYTSTKHISPLAMALLLNQSDLAEYFININYLMTSDVSILSGNVIFQDQLQSEGITKSVDLLKTYSQQPIKLQTRCFIVISDTLGSTCDRMLRVQTTGLPTKLQSLLMFKSSVNNALFDSVSRSLFHFKYSLQQSHLLYLNSDDLNDAVDGFESDNEDC